MLLFKTGAFFSGFGESDAFVSVIENGVEVTKEDVAKNPSRSHPTWEVECCEAELTGLVVLEDIIGTLKNKVLTTKSEYNCWQF
ncbi:unnamed protein product [Haemonchus placei]|uniref:Uncharacterized protein n=1 Tax=Haemonchus placei TaxID=6290 RepID=A0A3P7XGX0_HAEPC|nr:unnamed protein product [Haemonchus placei]